MTDLDKAAGRLAKARAELDAATTQARTAARDAISAGASESETARRLGVTRTTIRAWTGKDTRSNAQD